MSTIRIGCQTYTWEMLGDRWRGTVDDILDATSAAGYAGIEISANVIGDYYDRPEDFARAIRDRGLAMAAFAYASPHGFTDPAHWEEETRAAERALAFAGQFEHPLLGLGGAASPDRSDYDRKLEHACQFYNRVGVRGREIGVRVAVHPHSHHGSLVKSTEEYDRLLAKTDPATVAFNPDVGHIIRGGQDAVACFRRHLDRIAHVHFKDVDGRGSWRPMGEGVADFAVLLGMLSEAGYEGWVVLEEESDAVFEDERVAIRRNREYLRSLGY